MNTVTKRDLVVELSNRTGITQSQRAGFAVIFIFLVGGIIGLRLVREERAAVAA